MEAATLAASPTTSDPPRRGGGREPSPRLTNPMTETAAPRRQSRRLPLLGAAIAAVALALLPIPALAHPYLVSADPAADSVLAQLPPTLTLTYTEPLDAPDCSVDLTGPDGTAVRPTISVDGTRMTVALPHRQQRGTWAAHWIVVGRDGHRVAGDLAFSVGQAAASPGLAAGAGAAADTAAGADAGVPEEVLGGLAAVLAIPLVGLLLLGGRVLPEPAALAALAGRRLARLRAAVWGLNAGVTASLVGVLAARGGAASLLAAVSARMILVRLLLTLALLPIVFDGGRLALGERPGRRPALYGAGTALALLTGIGASGHALASPSPALDVAILTLHLAGVSLWAGALISLLVLAGALRGEEVRRFTPLVLVSGAVIAVTGLYSARANLGGLAQLTGTLYGNLVAAKVALFALTVAAGSVAAVHRMRSRRRSVGGGGRLTRHVLAVESGAAAALLGVAGVLAQLPSPVSVPPPSVIHARLAGTPLPAASNGRSVVTVTVAPGLVGRNRIVAGVETMDDNDLPVPVAATSGVLVTASCVCSSAQVRAVLLRVADGDAFAASAVLPAAGHWLLSLSPLVNGAPAPAATVGAEIQPSAVPRSVVIGLAGDLSGPDAERCQDAAIGLQVAAVEANLGAVVQGDTVRVLAADTRDGGPDAAVRRLAAIHPAVLGPPCGDPDTVAAVTEAAHRVGLPLVGSSGDRSWTLTVDPAREGRALADQVHFQGARSALLLHDDGGPTPVEVAAAGARLDSLGIAHQEVSAVGAAPESTAAAVRQGNPDSVVLVGEPRTLLPVLRALGALQPEWWPARGAVASSRLMSNELVSAAGSWTEYGRIAFASEVDPDDSPAIGYVSRLEQWYGGRRPSIDGVRGYLAGWVMANLLRDTAGDRSAREIHLVLARDFANFSFGDSYRLRWGAAGGAASRIAFFTTVFTNPLLQLGDAPATSHAGIFLKLGAFVRVTPYEDVAS